HDINYIALSGVLGAIGRQGEPPVPPLNLVGDFGGGGMLMAFGVACALLEARRSGRGQVIDAAMVEGSALLAAMVSGFLASGTWKDQRASNVLDTGAPWYEVYETKDGGHVAIGSIEERFFRELVQGLGLKDLPPQHDRARWPEMRARFEEAFRAKTRDEWCRLFDGSDACFAPVLSWKEAREHPHNVARGAYVSVGGVPQPAPAPRFSRSGPATPAVPPERGQGGRAALADWGFAPADIERLQSRGLGFQE
ncbi:MAG TPA: CaiB/BaiF CoA-transferase family protein, partial [Thermoanaerobaculia bacterium]|nr:CaiB/BaiF CoA-transferase family protein [Thermoanaerobaculia bacterium]